MGCDIHIYVERRNANGVWEPVKGPNSRIEDCRMYAIWARERGDEIAAARYEKEANEIESGDRLKKALQDIDQHYPEGNEDRKFEIQFAEDYYAPMVYKNWIFDGRNYNLFAILANVRNYHNFNPISEPRGIPSDVTEFVSKAYESWGCDAHSASYHTLQQLLDFNWDQVTTHSGWVCEREYRTFKEKGRPHSWSGGVGGGMVVHVSNEEMDRLIAGEMAREEGKQYYTLVKWDETYRESASHFIEVSIPKLQALLQPQQLAVASNGDVLSQYISIQESRISPEDVRIVFWFDN
jgi:hypothetical protein